MEDTDNKALIEEMLNEAKVIQDKPEVIHEGSEDAPAPMVMQKQGKDGYVIVYNTKTGEPSKCNYYMLPAQLRKRHDDGSQAFTTRKPSITPKRGSLKCMLHADSPNRAHYDELGLAVCKKSNLTNEYTVKRHMQKRHRDEWAVIEDEIKRAEKEEEKSFQRAILGNRAQKTAQPVSDANGDELDWDNAPVYVSDKKKK